MKEKNALSKEEIKRMKVFGVTTNVYDDFLKYNEASKFFKAAKDYQKKILDHNTYWESLDVEFLSYMLIEMQSFYQLIDYKSHLNDSPFLNQNFQGLDNLVDLIDQLEKKEHQIIKVNIKTDRQKEPYSITLSSKIFLNEFTNYLNRKKDYFQLYAAYEKKDDLSKKEKALFKKTTRMLLKKKFACILYKYFQSSLSSKDQIPQRSLYILGGYCLYLVKALASFDNKESYEGDFNSYLYKNFERALKY